MRDRSTVWIALADLLLCVLSVVIVAVAPAKTKHESPERKAEFLIMATWPDTIDADVDLWVLPPTGTPIMYGNRAQGCGYLDQDSRGWSDSHVTLPDGRVVIADEQRETVTLRCLEPGHFDVGAHLYAFHQHDTATPGAYGIKVHVEIVRLNPVLKTEWRGDVTLDHDFQFDNAVSFDLSPDGSLTLVDPPLEPFGNRFIHKGATP